MNENTYYVAAYIIFFALAIVFSTLSNGLFLRFARTLGIRQITNENIVRWASTEKPSMGGFSFFIIFLISVSGYAVINGGGQEYLNKQLIGILLAGTLGFLVGLADDSYDTNPMLKFCGQFVCAVILISTGIYIHISGIFFIDALFTIFWVTGIMNSINMLDNMDGITASTSLVIFGTCLLCLIFQGLFISPYSFILIGLMGAIIGFLYYNVHPSKMYMGDTGSQFIGVFLAAMGIICFWNSGSYELNISTAKNLLLPLVVFIMPIVDTTIVTVNRLSKGKSPFVGGKDHTTHALAYLGLTDRQVAHVFWCVSLVSLLIVFIIQKYLMDWKHIYTLLFSIYFLTILGLFFYASRSVKSGK